MGGIRSLAVQMEAGFQVYIPFRFEKFWLEHPTFKERIKQWWHDEKPEQGASMLKLYKKLKIFKYRLKEWNKDTFGNINQEKKNIEEKIKKLQETCILEGYNEKRKKE